MSSRSFGSKRPHLSHRVKPGSESYDLRQDVEEAFVSLEDLGNPAENAVALSAFDDTGLETGHTKFVQSFKDYFTLQRDSVATVDTATVLATSTGVGRWVRLIIRHPSWGSQTTWSVAPITGSDENAGTPGSPLKTLAEFGRRVRSAYVSMTVTQTESSSENFAHVIEFMTSGLTLMIQGEPSVAAAGTITTVTDAVTTRGACETGLLTSAEVPSWASHVGKLVETTNGAQVDSVAAIFADSGGTAKVSWWAKPNGLLASTGTLPSVGDAFRVLSLPTVGSIRIVAMNGGAYVKYLETGTAFWSYIKCVGTEICSFIKCYIGAIRHFYGRTNVLTSVLKATGTTTVIGGQILFSGGASLRALTALQGPSAWIFSGFILYGAGLVVGASTGVSEMPVVQSLSNGGGRALGVFNAPGDAIRISAGGSFFATTTPVFGKGNVGYGFRVDRGSSAFLSTGIVMSITGTAGDLLLGGVTTHLPAPNLTTGAWSAGATLATWADFEGTFAGKATYWPDGSKIVTI